MIITEYAQKETIIIKTVRKKDLLSHLTKMTTPNSSLDTELTSSNDPLLHDLAKVKMHFPNAEDSF